jgi:branched-chain amino acid transport system ATP-binding protein
LLKVDKINVFYDDLQALYDVSLEVKDEELIAVIGSNGAGKTTLLKTISGIKTPASGAIYFDGERADRYHPHELVSKGISHVREGRGLFPYLTVIENLRLGAYISKSKEQTLEILNDVFSIFPILQERKKQLAGTLSGGEQQMLAIARGLMSKPKLLMLDEPSLGLSPLFAEKVFQTTLQIRKRGVTTLLVEQNVNIALALADRAYVLENGRVIMSGKCEELVNSEQVKKAYLSL